MPDSTIAADFVFDRCAIRRDARQLLIDGQPGCARAGFVAGADRSSRSGGEQERTARARLAGTSVEENNLQVHVSARRKLLGPPAIATIPGRGYRFTATPAALTAETGKTPANQPDGAQVATSTRQSTDRQIDEPTLFGRDDDVTAVRRLITGNRLITLVGAGGIARPCWRRR